MIEGSGRRFDAQRPRTAIEATAILVRRQWPVVVALVFIASVLELLSFGLLYVDATGTRSVHASIASISIFVSVDPQASPAEVDALGPLIRATPGVGETTLRAKDDAIKALIAKGLPPPDGRNPLADVWIVRLEPATIAGRDHRRVAPVVAEIRRALGGLPKVDAVTTDETWVSKVDELSGWWTHDWPVAFGIGLILASGVLACAAFLSGHALHSALDTQPSRVQVLAIFGTTAGIVSLGIASMASWAFWDRLNVGSSGASQMVWSQFAQDEGVPLSAVALLFVFLLAVLTLVGGRRSK